MSASVSKALKVEKTDFFSRCDFRIPLVLAVIFLLAVAYLTHLITGELEHSLILVVATVFGAYMALNIGANDVANNLAPAVGAKAITLTGALIIAAIFESAGAMIAGGDVVSTLSKSIINPELLESRHSFILLMMSALLAGALWINLATYISAPVSTTHSTVGAIMGAGVAAAGVAAVDWHTMGKIAASWVVSPVLGSIIAALCYAAVLRLVVEQQDKLAASRRWVPVLIGIMVSAFTMYLLMKGLKNIVRVELPMVVVIGLLVLVMSSLLLRPVIDRQARKMHNTKNDVRRLFTYPLIFSAALLSFAHGANDVSNAVGPLAAIVGTLNESAGALSREFGIPFWVMAIGAVGISIGLVLYGGKMVNTVGKSITKLDHVRAYCVSLSAAVTVIVASALGLPVSSTHIAVGAIFGIGLFREWRDLHVRRKRRKKRDYEHEMIKRKLVRRRSLLSITATWVITVPSSFFLAAVIYLGLYYVFPQG